MSEACNWSATRLSLSGPGSLSLSGGAQIGTDSNGYTLTNQSTITGTGLIGSNAGALYQNLNVTNGGTIKRRGRRPSQRRWHGHTHQFGSRTLESQAGSTLHVSDTFSATNFSGGELSNGTYGGFRRQHRAHRRSHPDRFAGNTGRWSTTQQRGYGRFERSRCEHRPHFFSTRRQTSRITSPAATSRLKTARSSSPRVTCTNFEVMDR